MKKTTNSIITAVLAMSLLSASGCSLSRPYVPEVGHYFVDTHADFASVGKVAVLEFDNQSNNTHLPTQLAASLTEALQKRHLFTVKSIYRNGDDWQSLDISDVSSYSLKELAALRKQLKADAVIFGSITQHHPFPHMLTGLHLKMIDLRDGRLLWAYEQVWDSTDKRVEQRMKKYFDKQMRSGYQPMDWQLLITSPRAFNKFIIYEVAATLPNANNYMRVSQMPVQSGNFKNNGLILAKF